MPITDIMKKNVNKNAMYNIYTFLGVSFPVAGSNFGLDIT
jgi:hypothetical protein